ncbi:MAG TPA: hypothetical protein VLA72_11025 [Anaerolineales bacterium]|nr:hypothetical protein [Anaerolineales bacterium]
MIDHPVLDEFICLKSRLPLFGISFNPLNGFHNIEQALAFTSHNGRASFNTCGRIRGRNPFSVITSTGRLSKVWS